nr:hypothetical protein [uncultured Blautia sp.]
MNRNYIHTITLYNRIQAADSDDKVERWKKTVLHKCFWKSKISTSFNGTQANVQNTYVVRIPENENYLPYRELIKGKFLEHDWKDTEGGVILDTSGSAIVLLKKIIDGFTVSVGDIVVLGECEDDITGASGQTAAQILNRNKPNAFKVTAFSDNTGHFASLSKHYRLGG